MASRWWDGGRAGGRCGHACGVLHNVGRVHGSLAAHMMYTTRRDLLPSRACCLRDELHLAYGHTQPPRPGPSTHGKASHDNAGPRTPRPLLSPERDRDSCGAWECREQGPHHTAPPQHNVPRRAAPAPLPGTGTRRRAPCPWLRRLLTTRAAVPELSPYSSTGHAGPTWGARLPRRPTRIRGVWYVVAVLAGLGCAPAHSSALVQQHAGGTDDTRGCVCPLTLSGGGAIGGTARPCPLLPHTCPCQKRVVTDCRLCVVCLALWRLPTSQRPCSSSLLLLGKGKHVAQFEVGFRGSVGMPTCAWHVALPVPSPVPETDSSAPRLGPRSRALRNG